MTRCSSATPCPQILEYNEQEVLQWPQGSVTVQGADNGLVFDFYLNKTRPEQMFDPSLFRTMNISFQGAIRRVAPGLHACHDAGAIAVSAAASITRSIAQGRSRS